MGKYELVFLLDAKLQENDRKKMLADFEKLIDTKIIDKDDMGIRTMAYDLQNVTGQNKSYMISYYLELENQDITNIKEVLLYNKMVLRYHLFKMTKNQPFFKFDELQTKLTDLMAAYEEKKLGNKVIFFNDKRNQEYINWKSVTALKKYITRFGNIKPRKYTGTTVTIQKKLRTEIIRARELGVLEYIK